MIPPRDGFELHHPTFQRNGQICCSVFDTTVTSIGVHSFSKSANSEGPDSTQSETREIFNIIIS